MAKLKRKGELREATEGLLVSVSVEIEKEEEYLESLKKEKAALKKRLEEEE
jgi:hypothetical protein